MFPSQKKLNLKHRQLVKQTGAILVMFTIGLFSLLAVAALALDSGHMLLDKGRLQNAVDSSALYAGKVLQGGGSLYEAREAATLILIHNLQFSENADLKTSIIQSSPDYNATQVTSNIYIEFSEWPDPFVPIFDEDSKYVRVRIENVGLNNFIAQILNFDKVVRASAVAGKSTDIECLNRVVPLMVCGLNDDPDYTIPDPDSEGQIEAPFGLPLDTLYVMKTGSNQGSAIGAGNFQLLRLDGSSGGADIRRALAGEFTPGACVSPGDEVNTEPGNTVGPVVQGLNTRFGLWQGGGVNSDEHKRDTNICQGDRVDVDADGVIIPLGDGEAEYTHQNYKDGVDIASCISADTTNTAPGRRELPVVVGLCDGMTNGANTITSLGTGCFFLTQQISQQGNDAHVIGEFARVCSSAGSASLDPGFVSNTSTIVLYRDPDSPDS